MREEFEEKIVKIDQAKIDFEKRFEIDKASIKETHEANMVLLRKKFQREYSALEDECLMLEQELEKLRLHSRAVNEEIAEFDGFKTLKK